MPRRSARIKNKSEEQKDVEPEFEESSTSKKVELAKKTQIESVSNIISDDNDHEIEQKDESRSISVSLSLEQSLEVTTDVKRLSIDTNTILPPPYKKQRDHDDHDDDDDGPDDGPDDVEMADIKEEEEEDEYIDTEPTSTLAMTRGRRQNIKQKISYKDESSSDDDDEESDDDESDDEDASNPLFAGLSKKERKALRLKMEGMQTSYSESVRKERELKIEEIVCSFEFNIGEKVTKEEAGFIYDFCRKHQFDVNDKIEDEGDFFLCSMREMIEEKMKLIEAGIRTKKNNKKNKNKNGDDSDSEFDMNDFSDSDSEYSMDSDWDNPLEDNENMITDDDDDDDFVLGGNRRKRKRRKRNKNVWVDEDGREYRCAGRLLLDDALKDTENFEGWSAARVQAWKNKAVNPNAYYYRFNDPGVSQKNGRIGMDEHKVFMERVLECGVNVHWGSFSMKIPGRVGYQCSNYWRQMMKDQWVKDPNYWIRSDGSFQFKRAKKGSIPDTIRKYSFVVLKDPSKVFSPLPGYHPKRPTDKNLARYLQKDVKQLTDEQKKGGKRGKKKGRTTNNSNNSNNSNNNDGDDDEEVDDKKEEEKPKKRLNRRVIGKNGKKPPKDTNKPKQSQSSFLLFTSAVRSEFKEKNPDKKICELSKLMGLRWREMSDEEKKPFIDDAAKLKAEYQKKLIEYQQTENYRNYQKILAEWHEEQMKEDDDDDNEDKEDKEENDNNDNKENKGNDKEENDEENEDKKTKKKKDKKSKKKKDKKDTKNEEDGSEKEENEERSKKAVRGKKRKHSENEPSELEPPQKKRKLGSKSKNKNKDKDDKDNDKENDKENDHPLSILGDMVDIMTGERLINPAISPYGHVMEYNSWCSILRNSRTKNKCPFTQKSMTRRSLIKLDENNIDQYKDKIVNITAEDMKNLKTSSS